MFRASRGLDVSPHLHPWPYHKLRPLSNADLRRLCDEIIEKIQDGTYFMFTAVHAEHTTERILRILSERGSSGTGLDLARGFDFSGFGLGFPDILPRMSPALSITQTAPMPNLTIQSIPAPQQNITIQSAPIPQQNINFLPAPAPAPQPPPAALPDINYVAVYGPYGNVIGTRLETEKEKDDREYAAWKAEHGAK